MKELKLYMDQFDPGTGEVSFSVEDELGNRVDKATHFDKSIVMETMDFFLLSYLPKLMSEGNNIEVLGPISKNLISVLNQMQKALIMSGIDSFAAGTIKVNFVDNIVNFRYDVPDILPIAEVYLKNQSLDETLGFVFKYYS